ncbi:MAG: DUF4419 domain-containing protein [Bacteroidales bacterium]|nr:DUF4419 domain-containing protein [Bacteroidales bacterium]
MKRIFFLYLGLMMVVFSYAQPSITFAVDEVEPPTNHCGWHRSGTELAKELNLNTKGNLFSDWEPELLANSFSDEKDLYDIGQDVLFQMLLKAWCQHRPVTLSPDAIWLVICQQVSHSINENPEKYRKILVNHEGKKELKVETGADLLSSQADWAGLIAGFTAEIGKYTNNDIASSLVADFSTTGPDELIASEVTLMDAVKPYFDYTVIYAACGIPSITLTGTPEDWRKVLEKTRSLAALGFGWWTSKLEPILEEFVSASEGHPDYWFWKDIVKKTRPRTIQGPTCSKHPVKQTEFDGWFLQFFPFDNKGRTPDKVTITQTMLPETVVVPFKYQVVSPVGVVLSETPLELVAGIVGVTEDAGDFRMTPKIGWFVRTAKSTDAVTMDSSIRYWDKGPLSWADLTTRGSELPKISEFEYAISWETGRRKIGNTLIRIPESRSYMNPFTSWVHPDFRTPEMLQYIQTGFDYVEICRRRAQNDYLSGSKFTYPEVIGFHLDVAESFIAKMKDESRQGLDTAVVNYYSSRVRNELAQIGNAESSDLIINPKGFGIGMHLGVGSEVYTGPMAAYVTPIAGLDFGFDFTFSEFNLYLGGLLGWGGTYKKDIQRDGYQWEAGKKMTGGNLEASLGYTVFDSQWWRLAPFAGIGVGFIDYPSHPVDPDKKTDEISGFRFQAGLCADYKFFRVIESLPTTYGLSEFTVRARLYAAHTAFPAPAPAWTINFGLSANMLAWILKKK